MCDFYEASGTLKAPPTLTRDPFQLHDPRTAPGDPQSTAPWDIVRAEGTN